MQIFIKIISATKPVVIDDGGVAVDDDEGGDDPADDGEEPHVTLVRNFLTKIVNCAADQVALQV